MPVHATSDKEIMTATCLHSNCSTTPTPSAVIGIAIKEINVDYTIKNTNG